MLIFYKMMKTMTFNEFCKPNFEVNFWLANARGLFDEDARCYEAYIFKPKSYNMFFGNTCEYIDEDSIDYSQAIESEYSFLPPFLAENAKFDDENENSDDEIMKEELIDAQYI